MPGSSAPRRRRAEGRRSGAQRRGAARGAGRRPSAYRDIALFNAAAALIVAGKAASLDDGVAQGAAAIDAGAARRALERLIAVSNA